MRIGLVGCVKTKRQGPTVARDLYVSPLFLGRRAHVEQTCDDWFVLSAKHGLVHPDTLIEPYDVALNARSSWERHEWARTVVGQLRDQVGDLSAHDYEVHAGAAYRNFGLVERLLAAGATVDVPAAGLSQGEQLAYYADRTKPVRSPSGSPQASPAGATTPVRPRSRLGGKYTPLGTHLAGTDEPSVSLSFRRIEEILGASLPPSAHTDRQWWGNTDRRPQARAWMQVGYRVDGVDFMAARIRFRRYLAPSPDARLGPR